MKIAAKLKELRLAKNLEIKDVLLELQNAGFKVSEEEMLELEADAKSLEADMFLVLCRIYGCDDIMGTFGDFDKG